MLLWLIYVLIAIIIIVILLKFLFNVLAIAPIGYEHEMSAIQTAMTALRPT